MKVLIQSILSLAVFVQYYGGIDAHSYHNGYANREVGKASKKSKAGRIDCADFCGCIIEADEDPIDDELQGILV